MMENNRIANCIAIGLVLLGLVLGGGAGTFGPTAAPPQTDVDRPIGSLADGGTRFDFPINNVTAGVGATLSAFAFPIDNATLVSGSFGTAAGPAFLAESTVALAPGQDMDPY